MIATANTLLVWSAPVITELSEREHLEILRESAYDPKPIAGKQPISGLRIETSKIGGSVYGYVRHISSGKLVAQSRNPLRTGIRAFTKLAAEKLSGFDWLLDEESLAALPSSVHHAMRSAASDLTVSNPNSH